MKKVRITKSSSDKFWYADKIGEVYEVINFTEEYGYIVRVSDMTYDGTVSHSDCEVVENDSVTDVVNSPAHYNYGDIEVIDYIEQVTDSYEGKQAYLAGNIIKYVSRAPHKNGAEDIRKAIWYAERLAEDMERELETKGSD